MKFLLLSSLVLASCAAQPPRPATVLSKSYSDKSIVLRYYSDEPESRPLAQNEANTFCNGQAQLDSESTDILKKGDMLYGRMLIPVQHSVTLLTFKCK